LGELGALQSKREDLASGLRLSAWPKAPLDMRAEALAARAAHGDREAFEQLVHRFQRRLYGFAYRYIRDPDEAQDLVQEVFLRLHRKLGRFDPRRPFEPWLWRVAANVCANYLDRRVPRPTALDGGDHDLGAASPPALLEETRLGAAMSRLPPAYRLLLVLHYQADMPLAEIAETLGVSQVTVKSRLYRARTQLQHALLRQT
jgi:RNA polymerase sigma factor (sigma-70 family)